MADPLEKDLIKYKELLPTLTGSGANLLLFFRASWREFFSPTKDALQAGYKAAGMVPCEKNSSDRIHFLLYT